MKPENAEDYILCNYLMPQNVPMYSLCLLSELVALRYSHNGIMLGDTFITLADDLESYQTQLNFKIEYILSLVERYSFLLTQGDFFSRYRVGPLFGFAVGTLFGVDELLDTYPTAQLNSWEFCDGLSQELSQAKQEESIVVKIAYKLYWLEQTGFLGF